MLYRDPDGRVTDVIPGDINQVLTLIDDGSGNKIPEWREPSLAVQATVWFAPEEAVFDEVNPAGGGDVALPVATFINNRPALGFASTPDQGIAWQSVMPQDFDLGDCTVKVYFAPGADAAANDDTVGWQVGIERVSPAAKALDADAFDTLTTTVESTVALQDDLIITTIPLPYATNMDGLLAGEPFRLYLQRDTTVTDDLTSLANVVRVTLIEDAIVAP
jgi:hypothetical protein